MAHRKFAYDRKTDKGGRTTTVFTLHCSECGSVGEMAQKSIRFLPSEAVEQYFRNHGWRVGSHARKDVCPTCSMKQRRPKLEIVTMETKPTVSASPIPVQADKPREMSREDRRIVYARIEDTYDVKAGCFFKDWTDHRVAVDLGVPRSWVTSIREEFFGPEVDAATLKRREEVVTLRASVASLSQQIATLSGQLAVIERKLTELEK